MDDFTGKAASRAKNCFTELHQTILKSFEHLLKNLEERMENHLKYFEWDVDASDTAIIQSDYLISVEKEMKDNYEPFAEEHEWIRETINNISDISSAYSPSRFDHSSFYDKSIEIITELEENFETYINKDIEKSTEIDELLQNIETTIKDSGAVTEDNQFTYFMGSTTPNSLLTLQGYNQEKHNEMIAEATESRDNAIENMDEASEEIATKALNDLENGIIDEEEYYAYLDELLKLNNEEDVDENVSQSFIQYIQDSGDLTMNYIVETIQIELKLTAEDSFKRSDFIKQLHAQKPGAGSFFKEQGKLAEKIGRYLNGPLTLMTVGYATYMDYAERNKTWGQGTVKNVADAMISSTTSGGVTVQIYRTTGVIGSTSPIGWGLTAGLTAYSITTTGFNHMYDNNVLGVQDHLDRAGELLDVVGEAVIGSFDAINPFSSN